MDVSKNIPYALSIERTKHTNHITQASTIMTHITNAAENLVAIATAHLEVVKAKILMITSAPCIERCNSICAFPETGLTIGVDQNGAPIIVTTYTPTQFDPQTAREICAN